MKKILILLILLSSFAFSGLTGWTISPRFGGGSALNEYFGGIYNTSIDGIGLGVSCDGAGPIYVTNGLSWFRLEQTGVLTMNPDGTQLCYYTFKWNYGTSSTPEPTCNPDTQDKVNGKCVPKCLNDEVRHKNGVCIPKCGKDEHRADDGFECVPNDCGPFMEWSYSLKECIVPKYNPDNNNTNIPKCKIEVNGVCMDKDPDKPKCKIIIDGVCMDKDPDKPKCKIIIDGVCMDKDPDKPKCKIIIDGVCMDKNPNNKTLLPELKKQTDILNTIDKNLASFDKSGGDTKKNFDRNIKAIKNIADILTASDEYWKKDNQRKFDFRTKNDNSNTNKLGTKLDKTNLLLGEINDKNSSIDTSKIEGLLQKILDKNATKPDDDNVSGDCGIFSPLVPDKLQDLVCNGKADTNFFTSKMMGDSWVNSKKINLSFTPSTSCYFETLSLDFGNGPVDILSEDTVSIIPFDFISNLFLMLVYLAGAREFLRS